MAITPTATRPDQAGGPGAGHRPALPALVIVCWNSLEDLRASFDGQLRAAAERGMPLVAVDNASTDGTTEFLREQDRVEEHLRVIVNPANRGFAVAANEGIRAAGDRDVFLVNPDVIVESGDQISALSEFLASLPRAGVLAPRLTDPDGKAQPSARHFPSVPAMAGHASAARRFRFARRAAERYMAVPGGNAPQRVDWAIGAALLIRRAAWTAVGGFDERFFLYLEDADFCLRCSQAGWETWYVPEVSLRHGYARASDPARGPFMSSPARRRHIVSMFRFFARHPRLAFPRR